MDSKETYRRVLRRIVKRAWILAGLTALFIGVLMAWPIYWMVSCGVYIYLMGVTLLARKRQRQR